MITRYILKRFAVGSLQLLFLVIAVFFLIRLLPADPVSRFVGLNSSAEAYAQAERSLGLDQDRPGGPEPTKRPRLAATVDELAPEQVTITYEPGAKRAWIPSAEVAAIVRLGIGIDGDPTQSYLFDAGPLFVSGLDTGTSNRDIRFDPRPDAESFARHSGQRPQ